MIKTDVYTLDPETLRLKTESELCDIIEQLVLIIRDQDETITLQSNIIDSLQDDGK